MRNWILLIIILGGISAPACQKDDDIKKGHSFIYYSLNGASFNGEFRIDVDKTVNEISVVAGFVNGNEDRPDAVVMTFTDNTTSRLIYLTLPAEKTGPVLMDDSSIFNMGIYDGLTGWSLSSGVENTAHGVSVNITKFEQTTAVVPIVTLMEANFEGIMSYTNEMGIVELHTVKGDLLYNRDY